ncbi:unnamed protein product [Lactuca saligna]|uniref:F-box domain-containing protein n=1 Tax=Lactuca saligna TaxID=75948 RepID=A0AA36DZR8_LACSI|nr:unnamed protein product [Lactuca saligna]
MQMVRLQSDEISRLPDEIILQILNRLIDLKTLCFCYLVSKRFSSIVLQVDAISFLSPLLNPRTSDKNTIGDVARSNPFPPIISSFYVLSITVCSSGRSSLCLKDVTARHMMLLYLVKDLPLLEEVSITDSERRGRLSLNGEKLSEVKEWLPDSGDNGFEDKEEAALYTEAAMEILEKHKGMMNTLNLNSRCGTLRRRLRGLLNGKLTL